MARIFARELNVSSDLQEEQQIKEAIFRGDDLDVIEIDGASNRGVQEARDLIASAGLSPSRCTYRIYIIDEVHMLTTPAFNALLKTMEEPPTHVKFILCTTEPHKVPATIQSRCQRFDFKTIPSSKIAKHLTFVLQEEGVKADPEIVSEVARLGDGSMRDALSILDRLLAGGATTISADEMSDLLGLPSRSTIYAICNAIAASDASAAFIASDELISSGISADRILEVLAKSLRDALVARICGQDTTILELSDESRKQTYAIGMQLDEATISHMIALCDATSRQVRRGGSGRAIFDATISRLCMAAEVLEAGGVLSKSNTPVTKKKSQTPKPKLKQPVSPVVKEINPNPKSTAPKEVTWDSLQTQISSTPGLKKVASYLVLKSLDPNHLVLGVSDDGRETLQYIVAQRKMIEETISAFASRKITVEITATEVAREHVREESHEEQVEGNDLVNAARGLFEGTVVQVKNAEKEDL